jgi:hypothetical protein
MMVQQYGSPIDLARVPVGVLTVGAQAIVYIAKELHHFLDKPITHQ